MEFQVHEVICEIPDEILHGSITTLLSAAENQKEIPLKARLRIQNKTSKDISNIRFFGYMQDAEASGVYSETVSFTPVLKQRETREITIAYTVLYLLARSFKKENFKLVMAPASVSLSDKSLINYYDAAR